MATTAIERFHSQHDRLIGQLHARSHAGRWGLETSAFERALFRSCRSRFGEAEVDASAEADYLRSLHVEDLALACSCLEGHAGAWEHLVATFRHDLRAAGRAIAGGDEGAELADSIYAELYGLEERDGQRRSLLLYFHGRSRLGTWLRAVLARRHVDLVRERRRVVPLDEAPRVTERADPRPGPEPDRARYQRLLAAALGAAVGGLDSRQRLRLAWYYNHQLTLAQIGRLLGEHEATVSRKLDRARRDLRSGVERQLREEYHLTAAEAELCFDYAQGDFGLDLTALLDPGADAARGPVPSSPAARNGPAGVLRLEQHREGE